MWIVPEPTLKRCTNRRQASQFLNADSKEFRRGDLMIVMRQAISIARHQPEQFFLSFIKDPLLCQQFRDISVRAGGSAKPLGKHMTPNVEQRLNRAAQTGLGGVNVAAVSEETTFIIQRQSLDLPDHAIQQ